MIEQHGYTIAKDTPQFGGITLQLSFQNGYGASIIRHEYSYGGKDGLYELAPIIFSNLGIEFRKTPNLDPDDEDVYGYLSLEKVQWFCERISSYREQKVSPAQFYKDIFDKQEDE